VTTGDSGREAYTAIAWGVGLSLERSDIAGAESFYSLEGNMCGTVKRGAVAAKSHTGGLAAFVGTLESKCDKARPLITDQPARFEILPATSSGRLEAAP
jgi:hypothetical protein